MGQTEVWETYNWVCPHICNAIPARVTGVVTNVYEIQLDKEVKFLPISGLTDDKS